MMIDIFILISFFIVGRYAGEAPTGGSPTSNLRGIAGFLLEEVISPNGEYNIESKASM